MTTNQVIFFAIPKGRIQTKILPILANIGIEIEKDFFNPDTRKLIFSTNLPNLNIVQTRSFDVASFVASGKVDIGICGLDVIEEFPNDQILRLKNLNIGKCRLSLAGKNSDKLSSFSTHLKIATKYPTVTSKLLKQKGYQVETFKLNGAIELASHLGMSDFIVDLVSTGATLKANHLEEKEILMQISSYLIVNKISYQSKFDNIKSIIDKLI
ncbi:MAG: ATP phosphoribosyltransferase [Rickettsiales bacterium]|jgi:ATP phosphoribosyltransferase|nr:ATP phosphoribosyltransferase [Rickettsiales bacterium]